MAEYRRHEIVSGLFVLGAAVVFLLFAFRVGQLDILAPFRGEALICHASFPDVMTLDKGAKVTVAGQRVGSVRSLRLVSEPLDPKQVESIRTQLGAEQVPGIAPGMQRQRVIVEFAIEEMDLRIDRATARVELDQDGFLGRHYLALDPGYWADGSKPAPVREMVGGLPIDIETRQSFGIDAFLQSSKPILPRVDNILANLEKALDGEGVAHVRRALASVDEASLKLAALLDAENPDGVSALIVRPMNQRLQQIEGVLSSVQGAIDDNSENVKKLLAEVTAASEGLDDRLDRLDTQVHKTLTNLDSTLATAQGMAEENRPELQEIMRRLRRTMWELEMATRRIRSNPALLLFGEPELLLDADPADDAMIWRSGRARPYAQRDEKNAPK